ncbi:MAG: hypothetical protein WCZ87_05105 [Thiohalobacteraceae bacterium]
MNPGHLKISFAALTILGAAGVHADALPGSTFQALDNDVNGYITQDEAAYYENLRARWKDLDTDKNNLLDVSEFSAFELDGDLLIPISTTRSSDSLE